MQAAAAAAAAAVDGHTQGNGTHKAKAVSSPAVGQPGRPPAVRRPQVAAPAELLRKEPGAAVALKDAAEHVLLIAYSCSGGFSTGVAAVSHDSC